MPFPLAKWVRSLVPDIGPALTETCQQLAKEMGQCID